MSGPAAGDSISQVGGAGGHPAAPRASRTSKFIEQASFLGGFCFRDDVSVGEPCEMSVLSQLRPMVSVNSLPVPVLVVRLSACAHPAPFIPGVHQLRIAPQHLEHIYFDGETLSVKLAGHLDGGKVITLCPTSTCPAPTAPPGSPAAPPPPTTPAVGEGGEPRAAAPALAAESHHMQTWRAFGTMAAASFFEYWRVAGAHVSTSGGGGGGGADHKLGRVGHEDAQDAASSLVNSSSTSDGQPSAAPQLHKPHSQASSAPAFVGVERASILGQGPPHQASPGAWAGRVSQEKGWAYDERSAARNSSWTDASESVGGGGSGRGVVNAGAGSGTTRADRYGLSRKEFKRFMHASGGQGTFAGPMQSGQGHGGEGVSYVSPLSGHAPLRSPGMVMTGGGGGASPVAQGQHVVVQHLAAQVAAMQGMHGGVMPGMLMSMGRGGGGGGALHHGPPSMHSDGSSDVMLSPYVPMPAHSSASSGTSLISRDGGMLVPPPGMLQYQAAQGMSPMPGPIMYYSHGGGGLGGGGGTSPHSAQQQALHHQHRQQQHQQLEVMMVQQSHMQAQAQAQQQQQGVQGVQSGAEQWMPSNRAVGGTPGVFLQQQQMQMQQQGLGQGMMYHTPGEHVMLTAPSNARASPPMSWHSGAEGMGHGGFVPEPGQQQQQAGSHADGHGPGMDGQSQMHVVQVATPNGMKGMLVSSELLAQLTAQMTAAHMSVGGGAGGGGGGSGGMDGGVPTGHAFEPSS